MKIHIVDSNHLQLPALEDFLSQSRSNAVALLNLTSVEMHKANAEAVAPLSTAITHRYPDQVFVLRDTASIYTQRIFNAAQARRLIDARQSRAFSRYGKGLQENAPAAIAHRDQRAAEAAGVMWKLIADSGHIPATFKTMTTRFSRSNFREIRLRDAAFSRITQFTLLRMADEITGQLLQGTGIEERHWPTTREAARATLLYRYALSIVLLYTRWVYYGQQVRRGIDKIANDVIDMHLAAISTFFSGVLTDDRNLSSVQRELRYVLRAANSFVG